MSETSSIDLELTSSVEEVVNDHISKSRRPLAKFPHEHIRNQKHTAGLLDPLVGNALEQDQSGSTLRPRTHLGTTERKKIRTPLPHEIQARFDNLFGKDGVLRLSMPALDKVKANERKEIRLQMVRSVYSQTRGLLGSLWEHTHAPKDHRINFADAHFSQNSKANYFVMHREIGATHDKMQRHANLVTLILRREKLVALLKTLAAERTFDTGDDLQLSHLYGKVLDIILSMRETTCSLIEEVCRLRERKEISGPILFEQQNYVLKIQSDLNMLHQSVFGRTVPEISWLHNPLVILKTSTEDPLRPSTQPPRDLDHTKHHPPCMTVKKRGNIYAYPESTYAVPKLSTKELLKKSFLEHLKPPLVNRKLPPKITETVLVRVPPLPSELYEICTAPLITPNVKPTRLQRLKKTEAIINGEQKFIRGEAVRLRHRGAAQTIKAAYRGFIRQLKIQRARQHNAQQDVLALENNIVTRHQFREFRQWVEEYSPEWLPQIDAMIQRGDHGRDSPGDIDDNTSCSDGDIEE